MRTALHISLVSGILVAVVSLSSCTKDSGPIYIPPDAIIDTVVSPSVDTVDTTDTVIVRVFEDAVLVRGHFLDGYTQPPPNDTVSFSGDLLPIFNVKCNFCHPSNGNLDLSDNVAYDELVNVVTDAYAPEFRVVPFDTAASVMYHKIVDDSVFGLAMPPGGLTLTEDEKEMITTWILQGALNN